MKSKINGKALIVIIGVIIIPLLYSYFYLGAFWDPYSQLAQLPVAIVNEDTGATINEKPRNLGEELCNTLEEEGTLKFVFTDLEEAKEGTNNGEYYAMIVIPEEFSSNIASSATTDKTTATITYSPNEKTNYLASQILNKAVLVVQENLIANVDSEIVATLADKLNSIPNQMGELQNGITQIYDGSQQLKNGASDLSSGTSQFNFKFKDYAFGVSNLQSGSAQLNSGIKDLDAALGQLSTGANTLNNSASGLATLVSSTQSLAQVENAFNSNLIQYKQGVDSLIGNVSSIAQLYSKYDATKDPTDLATLLAGLQALSANSSDITTLANSGTSLTTYSNTINDNMQKLSNKSQSLTTLQQGIATLASGLSQAKDGSTKLLTGSETLSSGMTSLNTATGQLATASQQIADGAATLSIGTETLVSGVATAKDGFDTSMTDMNEQLNSLDRLSAFAENPVEVNQENVVSVPNYGTAFAPYFMSLSLWVGALIIFFAIYLDPDGKFKLLSRNSEKRILRSFAYLIIGVAQAILTALALLFGLGLEVENLPLYFASCILVSVAFISIVQFLLVYLKDIGKFLAILFLILQLTSCGGTFPMETVPKIFNVLYPYMPMTYSVDLFKQAISGITSSNMDYDLSIIAGIVVVFMALTILFGIIRMKKEKDYIVENA